MYGFLVLYFFRYHLHCAQAKVRGSITFSNVTFRYPSSLAYRDALHDVNFAITVSFVLPHRNLAVALRQKVLIQ